ncbi:hypothetical protein ASD78_13645 [Lysobacter sp. Root667]|uniref:hypothetical protein n=1 Tax=Lysobacter sp. Root667 TaxID=1736581 RepID=UPI0006F4F1BC|nr:hypothetical protein [Lysobacter sp. Root667]KRA74502.1 hypothetical protein ASD78_13645 [Lysobacter sp. Root667]
MEDNDIVRLEDLAAMRAATSRTARRTLLVAALVGPAAGLIVLAVVYLLYGQERLDLGYIAAGIFALLAVPQFMHWFRHYRSISRQLDALEIRVKNGERIYGSQAGFHSYR